MCVCVCVCLSFYVLIDVCALLYLLHNDMDFGASGVGLGWLHAACRSAAICPLSLSTREVGNTEKRQRIGKKEIVEDRTRTRSEEKGRGGGEEGVQAKPRKEARGFKIENIKLNV